MHDWRKIANALTEPESEFLVNDRLCGNYYLINTPHASGAVAVQEAATVLIAAFVLLLAAELSQTRMLPLMRSEVEHPQ